ncbi:MAG TPA: penicillin acylase family protein [bacterium]|nr:penicillin acylase family protein [bacterium]HQI48394.1 penicillin acylase family protein [bacterium]HQJ64482.1 penicillin acylase family protein [bacterium]
MTTFNRRLLFILIIILLCVAAFLIFGYVSLRRSVPPESGRFNVVGLQRPVEIGRDEWGVPHVLAEDEAGLYFAAGFSCAQDRLWEMDLLRRAALGRLAEIFGPELVPVDQLARTIGFGRLGTHLWPTLPEKTAANLGAYTAGVNAYIAGTKQLPLEFGVLRYQPAPWRAEESLAIMRLIGWLLSMGWHADPVYTEIAAQVDSLKFSGLRPEAVPGSPRFTVPPAAAVSTDALKTLSAEMRQGETQLRAFFGIPAGGVGSNAWVINGRLTRRGEALLANDTHLFFTVPSLYYLMHLQSPEINAVGAAFPGLPGLVVGRNEQIAWGITNGMIDDVDFFPLEPDSTDAQHYRFGRQRYAWRYYDETIAVRGGSDRKVRVTCSHIGPLVTAETPMLNYRGRTPLVLRWTGFEEDDPLTAFQSLLKARDWGDFLAALESCKNPGENFFYADRAGQVGWKLAAAVPRRTYNDALLPPPAADSLGVADSLAARGPDPEWRGFVPYAQLPQSFQPACGWIANANNCLADTSSAFYLSAYWEPDYRWQRIKAAFDTTGRWDVERCKALQADLYCGHAAFLVPRLLKALRRLPLPAGQPADLGRELLAVWDYQETPSSVAATLYETTLVELMRLTFADEMGEDLYRRFLNLSHVNIRSLDRLIAANDSLWFDNLRTPFRETLDDQLAAAYLAAIDTLTARYGDTPGMWSWGLVHTLTQPHPFGLHGPFRRYFTIGPTPSAGGNFTLNNSTFSLDKPFDTIVGPCIRQISDMSTSDWQVILPAGQSGHPFSRHFRDQQPLWQEGRLITLHLRGVSHTHPSWKWQSLRPVSAIP